MERDFYQRYYELEDRHWWFIGRRRILLTLLEERLGSGHDLSVLDFGCGTGTMAGHLSRFGPVQAVDADADAVAFCRRRGLTDVRHVPGSVLPFDEHAFDLVTALDVLEHIDDDLSALVELRRVLRPGGTLLCAVPAFPLLWGPQDEISHHFRRYVRPELRARLEDAGFTVLRASYFNSILFPPIAALRTGRRVVRAGMPPRREEALTSDFELGPLWLNAALARLFSIEARLVRTRDLPFGVSLLALCE